MRWIFFIRRFHRERAFTGGKRGNKCIVVLVGMNMAVDEKLKLVVVGKSKHLRCFRGVRGLHMTYSANGKVWMAMAIIDDFL